MLPRHTFYQTEIYPEITHYPYTSRIIVWCPIELQDRIIVYPDGILCLEHQMGDDPTTRAWKARILPTYTTGAYQGSK